MKLILGLGNPGKAYRHSRHNIGFFVVKALSQVYKIPLKKDRCALALTGKGKIKEQNIILAMPLTFMNLPDRIYISLKKSPPSLKNH